jgi:hypothetical protein
MTVLLDTNILLRLSESLHKDHIQSRAAIASLLRDGTNDGEAESLFY